MRSLTDSWWNNLFRVFLLSVVVVFLWVRPLNSPWHPFIAGDGLGYYSHLPATFIFGDTSYEYKWFNSVHDSNYVYSAFEDPGRNLLADYNGRKINKFYPGVAVLWTPFFFAAHAVAKAGGFRADGYSLPYQLAIGLASLCYLLAGLFFLNRLLWRMFGNAFAACLVPIAFFYGTHLFTYGVHANSLSHAYSFSMVTFFFYSLVRLRAAGNRFLFYLLAALLFLTIVIAIRPLGGLVLLAAPAFVTRGTFAGARLRVEKGSVVLLILLVLTAGSVAFINYRQTGSLLSYTYGGERFDFSRPHFFDALISYHLGLFTYVPLAFLSLLGNLYLPARQRWILSGTFLAVLFIYSCWWYWPVTKRAMIDFYPLLAVLLGAWLSGVRNRALWGCAVMLTVIYFQFKAMQMRRGVLDELSTYRELFWRHFFRTQKAQIYPVPPSTILARETERTTLQCGSYQNRRALVMSKENYIGTIVESSYPQVFAGDGSRKIRFTFDLFAEKKVKAVHAFFHFIGRGDSVLKEVPFYINDADLRREEWDRKEFGFEILPEDSLDGRNVQRIRFIVWNVDAAAPIALSEPVAEFLLTDRSLETVK